jgi:hypothetical protein
MLRFVSYHFNTEITNEQEKVFKVGRPVIHARSPVQLPFQLGAQAVCNLKIIVFYPTNMTLDY